MVKPGLEVPRWHAERQLGLGQILPSSFPQGTWVCEVQPCTWLCPVSVSSLINKPQGPAASCLLGVTDPQVPCTSKPHNPRIPFPKHASCSHCHIPRGQGSALGASTQTPKDGIAGKQRTGRC